MLAIVPSLAIALCCASLALAQTQTYTLYKYSDASCTFLLDPKVSPGYQTTHVSGQCNTDGAFSSEMFTCSGKTATVSYWTTTGGCISTPDFKDIPLNNCIPERIGTGSRKGTCSVVSSGSRSKLNLVLYVALLLFGGVCL